MSLMRLRHDGDRISDPARPAIPGDEPPQEAKTERESHRVILVGTFCLVSAIVLAALGAPIVTILVIGALGVGFLLLFFWAKEEELDEHYRDLVKEDEARQRFNDEVNMALRTTLRESVMVRCKYCGMLNDESSKECEQCGGPL